MFHSRTSRIGRSAAKVVATLTLVSAFTSPGAGSVGLPLTDTHESVPMTHDGTSGLPERKALTGSWVDTVSFPPETGLPPLKSLITFHEDETLVYADQGNVILAPATLYSAGHGAWKHLKTRTFAYTSLGLISDLSGNLVGYLKARGVYTVSATGNEYEGTTLAEVLAVDGSVLSSVNVTNAGKRIEVELP